jgi:2,4-dienoyl-CoA reductase (NADPH2)
VPTIATSVPRAAFAWVTQKMKAEFKAAGISTPLVTSNRINTPEVAEQILAEGQADMVSMARPLLADPQFVNKAAQGRADEINTCIACNQACLDHIFVNKLTSCLVNPRACHETELVYRPLKEIGASKKRIAVVGAGPAGVTAATIAAERGHEVHLYEASTEIGGQLNLAKQVPGKEEFHEMLRYLRRRIETTGVQLHLNKKVSAEALQGYDTVVVATGVVPRDPGIPGQDDPRVLGYTEVLRGTKPVGRRVTIIGAGGIGFDVAEYLTSGGHATSLDLPAWQAEWGVVDPAQASGGLAPEGPRPPASPREVTLLQRKRGKLGERLGKTTGWIHRAALKMKRVRMEGGVNYERIGACADAAGAEGAALEAGAAGAGAGSDWGLLVSQGERREDPRWILCDTVVLCAGQVSQRTVYDELQARGYTPGRNLHLIGGAFEAGELDAKRAIDQAARLAARL